MRVTIPTRRYANHIALATSICESSSCFEEVRCDALMEECDGWVTIPLQEPVVHSETSIGSYLQTASLGELQREQTSVRVNTFLVKREC